MNEDILIYNKNSGEYVHTDVECYNFQPYFSTFEILKKGTNNVIKTYIKKNKIKINCKCLG